MSGNMLIYEADIKKNQNVIRLPISKEIEKLNLEIKKKTRELFFTKNRKFKDESQKGC